MMKRFMTSSAVATLLAFLLPTALQAQGSAPDTASLHQVLAQLYEDMLPLCERLIGVGRGLAGFAALWYIASRVWRHLASAEPVDFYPLLRPFALGMAILLFPAVLGLLNGILQPTVEATGAMVADSDKAIALLLQQKEAALRHSEAWHLYVVRKHGVEALLRKLGFGRLQVSQQQVFFVLKVYQSFGEPVDG